MKTEDADDREHLWAEYARSYDRVLPRIPFYREVVGRHVAAMTAPGVAAVLDVGAGTGNVTVRLLRAGRRVTAVDKSPSMLAALRGKVVPHGAAAGANRLTVIEQDAARLPQLADGSFDGVTILLMLYAADDPAAVIGEAARLLRPGGAVIITEPKRCFRLQPLLDYGYECLKAEGAAERLRDDWERVNRVNHAFDPDHGAPLRSEDVERMLHGLGFDVSAPEDSHLGNCATIRARKVGLAGA